MVCLVERKRQKDRAGDSGGSAGGGCGQDEGKYFKNTDFYANSHRSSIRAPSSISDGETLWGRQRGSRDVWSSD